jgi:hypothetical protein
LEAGLVSPLAMSWQGISMAVAFELVSDAAFICICVLIAQAEPAEIGSHNMSKRQRSFFMA